MQPSDFTLLERIGRGSYGDVYKACVVRWPGPAAERGRVAPWLTKPRLTRPHAHSMHIKTGEIVAVKVIDLEHATDEIEDVQRVSAAHMPPAPCLAALVCDLGRGGRRVTAGTRSTGNFRHLAVLLPPAHAVYHIVPGWQQALVRARVSLRALRRVVCH